MEIRTKFNIPYKMSKEAIQGATFLSVDKEGHVATARGVHMGVQLPEMSESGVKFLEGLPERVIALI